MKDITLKDVKETLYGCKEKEIIGLVSIVDKHDNIIMFSKGAIKALLWILGFSIPIFSGLLIYLITKNSDLIRDIAILTGKLTVHMGGL
jgi:hypothetical protein